MSFVMRVLLSVLFHDMQWQDKYALVGLKGNPVLTGHKVLHIYLHGFADLLSIKAHDFFANHISDTHCGWFEQWIHEYCDKGMCRIGRERDKSLCFFFAER